MAPLKRILGGSQTPPVLLDELIFEILSWLPVKVLLRFKCVSKSLKSLISDPQFVKLHLHRSATNAEFAHLRLISDINDLSETNAVSCSVRSLLHNHSSTVAQQHVCSELQKPIIAQAVDEYCVVGSCNGLLCLAGLSVRGICQQQWVCLWNPSTRLRSKKSPKLFLNWLNDPYGLPEFGFGYDHISDTYKVVAVILDKVHSESQRSLVKVFSVGDNCWRETQSFPAVLSVRQNDGVYLSGSNTVNWVALRNVSAGNRFVWNNVVINQLVIVSLDLGKETSKQLLMPCGLDEVPRVQPTIGVLKDCLCFSHDYKRTHFVVWQMKEFGVQKSWTQLVKVSYQDLRTGCLVFGATLLPLCLTENGDVLIVSKFAHSPATLYKWRDNGLERYEIPNNLTWIYPKIYVESLVLPC